MAKAFITKRMRTSGPRYVVRFRLGGRTYPLQHGGSFKTMREAESRRDLIAGLIAGGQNPDAVLHQAPEPVRRTFKAWSESYKASRVDYATATANNLNSHLKSMTVFEKRDPATITVADIQEWVAGLAIKPRSVSRYTATLRQLLDFAGVDPLGRAVVQDREQLLPGRRLRLLDDDRGQLHPLVPCRVRVCCRSWSWNRPRCG